MEGREAATAGRHQFLMTGEDAGCERLYLVNLPFSGTSLILVGFAFAGVSNRWCFTVDPLIWPKPGPTKKRLIKLFMEIPLKVQGRTPWVVVLSWRNIGRMFFSELWSFSSVEYNLMACHVTPSLVTGSKNIALRMHNMTLFYHYLFYFVLCLFEAKFRRRIKTFSRRDYILFEDS